MLSIKSTAVNHWVASKDYRRSPKQ